MARIADIVKLKTGYANFVELESAFEEAQENADRMAMYRPTRAHRRAFDRLCQGLYQPNDKKFYLLSGSYGTGKSHLCLWMDIRSDQFIFWAAMVTCSSPVFSSLALGRLTTHSPLILESLF